MEILKITNDLLKYESFVNDVLKVELNDVCERLDLTNCEMMEYMQLKNMIQTFQQMHSDKETFKAMVDIGCSFYMQANVDDVSKILMNIGNGYFVQLTLEESLKYVENQIRLLEVRIKYLRDESAGIKAHIKLILLCMQQWPQDNDDKKEVQ